MILNVLSPSTTGTTRASSKNPERANSFYGLHMEDIIPMTISEHLDCWTGNFSCLPQEVIRSSILCCGVRHYSEAEQPKIWTAGRRPSSRNAERDARIVPTALPYAYHIDMCGDRIRLVSAISGCRERRQLSLISHYAC